MAFDTICHRKLLQRLWDYLRVPGVALKWINFKIINNLSRMVNTLHRLHTVYPKYLRDPSSGRCSLWHTCRQLLMSFAVMECFSINMRMAHNSMLQPKRRYTVDALKTLTSCTLINETVSTFKAELKTYMFLSACEC